MSYNNGSNYYGYHQQQQQQQQQQQYQQNPPNQNQWAPQGYQYDGQNHGYNDQPGSPPPPLPPRTQSVSGQHQAGYPNYAAYQPQSYAPSAHAQYNPQAYASIDGYSRGNGSTYNPGAFQQTQSPRMTYSPAATYQSQFQPAGQTQYQTSSPAQYYPPDPQVVDNRYQYSNGPPPSNTSQPQYQSSYTYPAPSPQVQMPTGPSPPAHNTLYRPETSFYEEHSPINPGRQASVSPLQQGSPYDNRTLPSPPVPVQATIQAPLTTAFGTGLDGMPVHSVDFFSPSPTQGPTASLGSSQQRSAPDQSLHRTDTLTRHPQERPLPAPPPADNEEPDDEDEAAEHLTQENLFNQIENAVMGAGPTIHVDAAPQGVQGQEPRPLFSSGSQRQGARTNGDLVNGHLTPDTIRRQDSDSDADLAAAGLEAMRVADEQDAADAARRQTIGPGFYDSLSSQHTQVPISPAGQSDHSDTVGVDMSLYGGGFDVGQFSYGGDPSTLAANYTDHNDPNIPYRQHSHSSSFGHSASNASSNRPFASPARVDGGGTGGFMDPAAALQRRLSYDEGDEGSFGGYRAPYPLDETGATLFSSTTSRPLPPPPPGEDYFLNQPHYSPDAYQHGHISSNVPRSTSLLSQPSHPQINQPMRSKTDAEKSRQQALRSSGYSSATAPTPTSTGSSAPLDLPALPAGKRFNPTKLSPNDFRKCYEPWALSSIMAWLRGMAEGEADLRDQTILDGLVALFTHKVPTLNIADAEGLSARVLQEAISAGALVREEEWLKFGQGMLTGVLYQLTGFGCYGPRLHELDTSGRCYSHHCQRTLKKVDLQTQAQKSQEDWATFYKLKKEDVEGANKKEIERQNILHEIVQTEDGFMDQLNVLRVVYRDALAHAQQAIIPQKRRGAFIREVFGYVDAIKKVNEEYLLPQLKYRQKEQGPWIVGFSDIFREWIRKARTAYIEYAQGFPKANFLVRQEAERNMLFKAFLEQAQSQRISNKLGWDTYLKAPITRLQRYSLLLQTVHKNMKTDSEEKTNLQTALDEIRAVTYECDSKVAEQSRKVDLVDLQSKLVLRPGMQGIELNLDHLGRELVFKGDLQRIGANRFNWLETHALLFDHYLVLAKTDMARHPAGGMKYERYDVSRLPIPMDLLQIESSNDDPVVKSGVRGIASVNVVNKPAGAAPPTRPDRSASVSTAATEPLSHASTNTSLASPNSLGPGKPLTNTSIDTSKDERIMYPFKIKHLGKETYTLYAPSAVNRQQWCDKILEAKTKHAAALWRQNAEPFQLRVMADTAFSYDSLSATSSSFMIKGTPLDRGVEEVEKTYQSSGRPAPICRAKVNCATTFTQQPSNAQSNQPNQGGKSMVAVGTDYGVFVTQTDNPRGWMRAITIPKVTQIAILEEFGLFLLIADKSLVAYHLDVVCPPSGVPVQDDSMRKAPQKLSGSKDVGFFSEGKMKDRTLVFYKKKEGLSSTFKVLEPVFQRSTEKKSRMFRRGTTDFFRDYDEFYIPTECMGINLFHSSLAVSTSKGFEVLTLDKKQPMSIPDLKQANVANIASRLANQNPLGMFRLSDAEFLLCYEECAVYVNKHGEINRSVIMEFVGKARGAALYGPYVILFDPDFVEIRNADNGRLRQVISGRDVKVLDDGGTSASGNANRTVKFVMQHPNRDKIQLVLELLLKQGQKD